jgi:hypothetical protein
VSLVRHRLSEPWLQWINRGAALGLAGFALAVVLRALQ